jgi:23S rRNA pseudouridine1911/1915/1917 synthase
MAKAQLIRVTASDLAKPIRLDRFLRDRFPLWGRQAVQRLIAAGKVKVGSKVVRLASWEVVSGDRLEIVDPPPEKSLPSDKFDDAWLIAEEPDLIAVNKPSGLLSECTRFSPATSLLDLASARFGPLVLFHRLDRDTSGVVLLTRPGPVNQYLDAAFKSRAVRKEYLVVVATPNHLAASGVIDARLGPSPRRRDQMIVVERGGQRAVTRYAIEEEAAGRQLIRLWPETGRTHQLRVHLAHMQAPILGDRLYGSQSAARLLLHAERIALPSAEGYSAREFRAPLPEGFW